ncbi:MAG: tetratricopeptide repeat protein [Saprospiraceae bacterium]|nr:tetratricopeptide repeat protein [Saprospiraceae bacterium]
MSQIEYLYGQIYLCLIRGGTLLMSDLELAIKEFHIVQELCKDNTIELELAHSFFGLGEAYRIKGEYEFSLKYYTQALDIYKFKGVKWGILRISLALKELKNVPQKFSKATFNINLSVDHWIENNRIKMLTIKSDILFINIP